MYYVALALCQTRAVIIKYAINSHGITRRFRHRLCFYFQVRERWQPPTLHARKNMTLTSEVKTLNAESSYAQHLQLLLTLINQLRAIGYVSTIPLQNKFNNCLYIVVLKLIWIFLVLPSSEIRVQENQVLLRRFQG